MTLLGFLNTWIKASTQSKPRLTPDSVYVAPDGTEVLGAWQPERSTASSMSTVSSELESMSCILDAFLKKKEIDKAYALVYPKANCELEERKLAKTNRELEERKHARANREREQQTLSQSRALSQIEFEKFCALTFQDADTKATATSAGRIHTNADIQRDSSAFPNAESFVDKPAPNARSGGVKASSPTKSVGISLPNGCQGATSGGLKISDISNSNWVPRSKMRRSHSKKVHFRISDFRPPHRPNGRDELTT